MTSLVGGALDLLDCTDAHREVHEQELRTLLAGLGLEVCLGTLAPDAAVSPLDRAVRRLGPVRLAE